ncbi:MAG: hypothetical protein A2Y20_09420 [Firmicutes bacterium GWF2_51_9]|nr:MAG: hypothetical protein A2Y20_09420 [Firmicutes bacterium GWF2_51_9]OGS57332.1 MAG: hypothetical protein A2Y19_02360 [Firmicutes bacterium GWE2_51_13]HAM62535.1 hypothetical protein [Erysipelotrichaceae bacterium]HBZ41443.1 hypothetical protein [Erysipelotrichaceae bacterium]
MKKLLTLLLLLSILLSGCGMFRKNTVDSDPTLDTKKIADQLENILDDLDTMEVAIDEINDDELIQP